MHAETISVGFALATETVRVRMKSGESGLWVTLSMERLVSQRSTPWQNYIAGVMDS